VHKPTLRNREASHEFGYDIIAILNAPC